MHGCYTRNSEVWSSLFLVVRTSIGIGCGVGTIVPQYENEELITEGLSNDHPHKMESLLETRFFL